MNSTEFVPSDFFVSVTPGSVPPTNVGKRPDRLPRVSGRYRRVAINRDPPVEAAKSDYVRRPRTFGELAPLLGEMYNNLESQPEQQAYLDVQSPTRHNIMILPPWKGGGGHYCGSTVGYFQYDPSINANRVLEVCEVMRGFGALVIDEPDKSKLDLFLLRRGDKVATPNDCIATFFNLGHKPLVLHNFSNPKRRITHSKIQRAHGPTLELGHGLGNFRAQLNPRYLERIDGFGSIAARTNDPIGLPVADNKSETIFELLQTARASRQFELRGIRIQRPSLMWIERQTNIPIDALSEPLASLRKDQPHPLQEYFFRDDGTAIESNDVPSLDGENAVSLGNEHSTYTACVR